MEKVKCPDCGDIVENFENIFGLDKDGFQHWFKNKLKDKEGKEYIRILDCTCGHQECPQCKCYVREKVKHKPSKTMKKHNCEKYRFTTEKFESASDGTLDLEKKVFVSWCSLCGKRLRVVKVEQSK